MSNVSRSSIDLGVQGTYISSTASPLKDIPRVPHPARLQHSPSLPNIWFPPHSGPSLHKMSSAEKELNHRPSAPPSPSQKTPVALVDKELPIRHVKYASIDPTHRKASAPKTHARRRTERDQPHSLLTPPLTPSSSIRTNASTDYTASATSQPDRDLGENLTEDILDADADCTRILLLENVNRKIDIAVLEATILHALACTQSQQTNADIPRSSSTPPYPRDPVKGMNSRLHAEEGKVFMVFFDVRVAKATRDTVIDKDAAEGRLKDCIDKLIDEDGHPLWLAARLITLEDLSKILGHSKFLDGIDSSFSLTVHKVNHKEDEVNLGPTNEATRGEQDSQSNSNTEDNRTTQSEINGAILQNILKSFGSIRSLRFSHEDANIDGSTAVYHIEYHDLRDADKAYEDLNGQTMFGMYIEVFGKNLKPENMHRQYTETNAETVPFPNVLTAGESFNGLRIGAPGSHSKIRQRFFPSHERSPNEPQGGYNPATTHSQSQPHTGGGTSSPPVFYVSSFMDLSNQSRQTPYQEQDPNQPSHLVGPPDMGAGQALPLVRRPALVPEPVWDQDTIYRSGAISPCYNHDGICSYCPSRGAMHGVAYHMLGQYGLSPSPTPSIYYPAPSMMNQSPTPTPLAYEHTGMDPQSLQALPAAYYDPAIAAVGPGLASQHAVRPSVQQHLSYAHYSNPNRSHIHHSIHGADHPERTVAAAHHTTTYLQLSASSASSASSPSSHHSPAPGNEDAQTSATSYSAVTGHADRNQLNLAKIMEGEELRTTIMIKNIPNKMSDEDLTSYIAKVCPRRIDFLYLRMDFKNGCNVGYAFVNFITVQDLLHFGQQRLGAKWNMFSSEKVLQMSFANVQGKEALVEKFKNSAIMDEREAWRPRIFYSQGPQQGLPEPFPAPTHIRRKERSSHNRGTLFPPGMNTHNNTMAHNWSRRQHDEPRHQQEGPLNERLLSSSSFHHGRQTTEGNSGRRGAGDRHANYRSPR